jgi:Putative auto-transporter adhesin, head GIN domain
MNFMKKILILLLLFSGILTSWAQQTEVRQVGSFSGVKSGEAIDVYLKKGDKESVKVEATSIKLSDVITEVSGSYLKIHMRSGIYRSRGTIKVYVTYVSLNKISASSASNVFSEGMIKANLMDISVSSAAQIELQIESENLTIDASSAGDIVLEGKAKSLEVEASSAGDVDAYNLESEIVEARASSGGSVKINVTKELDAQASSGGSIRYRGNPLKTNSDSSSGGSVKKSN